MRVALQSFDVGPIVGAVSSDTARLWGRAAERRTDGDLRRVFGAARLRKTGGSFGSPQYFKLNPAFDLTGVTVFQGLQASADYEYQIGACYLNAEFADLANAEPDWSNAHDGGFRTASDNLEEERSFVFGSCRYLLRLFGGSWFDARGDKTFRSIVEQLGKGKRIDQLLMLGDQIYADDLNIVFPDQSVDEYFKRYRDVFSQEHFSELVSRIPTYMTLDDHEIEDNWPARATPQDIVRKFPVAMHAYLSYQLSHSPLFAYGPDGRLTHQPDRYWYQFSDGCCEFFIMDCRTERLYGDDGERLRMIGEFQMDALKTWLADDSGSVKVIATSVPFFPDLVGPGRDRWDSFAPQRNEILDHVRANQIRRVVFLSGDVHSSMSAELRHPDDDEFKVVSVVSSPLYWPYRHSHEGSFQLSGELSDSSGYQVRRGSPVHATDNFTRVTVDREGLRAEFFERKGRLLGTKNHRFAP